MERLKAVTDRGATGSPVMFDITYLNIFFHTKAVPAGSC